MSLDTFPPIPDRLKSVASQNRRFIIRCLLKLPEQPPDIAKAVTELAKKRGLIPEDRKSLDGTRLRFWSNKQEDEKNIALAWACTGAMHLLIERGLPIEFPHDAAYWAAVYYLSPSEDPDVIRQNQRMLAGLYSIRDAS